jgi:hypothetical protein
LTPERAEGELKPPARIVVDDGGPGLTPAEREQEARRGQWLDETKPGSGLGLSIVLERRWCCRRREGDQFARRILPAWTFASVNRANPYQPRGRSMGGVPSCIALLIICRRSGVS